MGDETERLLEEQRRRERFERAAAEEEDDPQGERKHARRAERAAYLREKLGERAGTEDEED